MSKIQSTELRINNIVQDSITNLYFRVISIERDNFKVFIADDLNVGNNSRINCSFGYSNPVNLVPVQISEEILFKCGFKECSELNSYTLDKYAGFYFEFRDYHGKINIDSDYDAFVTIGIPKYLHQLQNLYFALTEEELQITI